MRIEEIVVVGRPVDEVFAVLADLESRPRWLPTLKRVELIARARSPSGRPAPRCGACAQGRSKRASRSSSSSRGGRSRSGPARRHRGHRRLHLRERPRGHVEFELEKELAGVSRLRQPLLHRILTKETRENLRGLKELLERP